MALELLHKVLAVKCLTLGDRHLSVASTHSDLAATHRSMGSFDAALEEYNQLPQPTPF